jgi:hypothetical protein
MRPRRGAALPPSPAKQSGPEGPLLPVKRVDGTNVRPGVRLAR